MNTRFATVVIWITALTYGGFSVWLGVRPDALLEGFGIEDRTAAMATEIRAFYGGVEMGIAAAMLVFWKRGDFWSALLAGALPLAGSAVGRCLGMLADGFAITHAAFAGLELVGAIFCFAAMHSVGGQHSVE